MANRILVVDHDELVVLDRWHARIVATGEVIPSFAGGIGGGGDAPPPPSAEEKAAYAKQAEATDLYLQTAKKQQATADVLEPYLYKQLGLQKNVVSGEREQNIARIQQQLQTLPQTVQVQTAGTPATRWSPAKPGGVQTVANPALAQLNAELQNWQTKPQTYSLDELPPSASEQQRAQIQDLANKREIDALQGNLPVDPSVEQDINRGQAQMNEELARRGIKPGSGDIYNRAVSEYQRGANALRYNVRTGAMTGADAIASNRQQELQSKQNQYLNQALGQQTGSAALVGQAAGQQGGIANMYTSQRFKQYDYDVNQQIARGQGTSGLIGSGIGAVGTGVGAYFIGGAMIA